MITTEQKIREIEELINSIIPNQVRKGTILRHSSSVYEVVDIVEEDVTKYILYNKDEESIKKIEKRDLSSYDHQHKLRVEEILNWLFSIYEVDVIVSRGDYKDTMEIQIESTELGLMMMSWSLTDSLLDDQDATIVNSLYRVKEQFDDKLRYDR